MKQPRGNIFESENSKVLNFSFIRKGKVKTLKTNEK